MKEIYKDYIPANARVIVDYTKKDKVKFSYPKKYTYEQAVWKCAFPTVAGLYLWIMFIAFYTIGLPAMLIYMFIKADFSSVAIESSAITWQQILNGITPPLIIIYIAFGIPAIITLWLSLDKDRMGKLMPKMAKWFSEIAGKMRIRKFNPTDMKDNKAIIPIFKNMYLDYKATEDFGRYLTRIEIMEIPVDNLELKLMLWFKVIKRKKVKYNNTLFSAVFYFSKRPKSGKLEVEYI